MIYQYPHTDAEVSANQWEEITEERYHEALGSVPPARHVPGGFAVGEPLDHMNDGRVVHTVCVRYRVDLASSDECEFKFYSKPYPLDSFDMKVFKDEIQRQRAERQRPAGLKKIAIRRKNDGTPTGQPAPCFLMCPCGTKVPVRNRDGSVPNPDEDGNVTCRNCEASYNADGWIVENNLFIGIFPAGISYADRSKEDDGDWKQIAFLPYRSLELEIRSPKSNLLPAIKKHAATVQARRGELFEVSACGQTVKLGS